MRVIKSKLSAFTAAGLLVASAAVAQTSGRMIDTPTGTEAKDFCSKQRKLPEGIADGAEVARHYGAKMAMEWTKCVVDRLVPIEAGPRSPH